MRQNKKLKGLKSTKTTRVLPHLLSLLLSLSAGLLPLFLWPSRETWTRSGPATEPVSLPEADVPADSPPISGTLRISSSLSIPKFLTPFRLTKHPLHTKFKPKKKKKRNPPKLYEYVWNHKIETIGFEKDNED